MNTPQQDGINFEKELAKEFGLQRTPASGSVWYSKLDMRGNNARWSLKSTERDRFPLTLLDIEEALDACYGTGGDGATPLWAIRNPLGDFIVMRKEDWIAMNVDDIKLINEDRPQVAARKERARRPQLLREDI